MRRLGLVLIAMISFASVSSAQTESFEPSGKPLLKIYSNYHSTFMDGESNPVFELTRVYLGYEHTFSKNFSAKANLDVGDPEDGGKFQMTAFVKNAFVRYKQDQWILNFGLISTTQFKVQEDFWGYRYLAKSFQDEYKFNSSADLGFSAAYKLNDMLNFDFIVANGEGYKQLQSDSVLRYGIGATVRPIEHLVARVYYDYSHKLNSQTSITTFLGYEADKFSVGAEYNLQQNVNFTANREFSGTSFYVTVKPCKKMKVFARYDMLTSNTLEGATSNWQNSRDGELYIAGVEYAPVKGVKIAPNFQGWNPADASKSFSSTFILNCEFKF